MAAKDVITRFKLETTQYDSKIKEAARELSAYSKTATQAKEGFNQFTKANVEAAKALGTMATSATNVKDRTKELVSAFNDAAKAYNSLTKEQQQSDWAQALAGSLTQLQQRIKETKAEMQGIGDSMKNVGGGGGSSFEDALSVFAGNMATKATSALMDLGNEVLNVTKESMQMAAEAEGVESAFARLNNPGLLDGLRQATHGTVSDLDLMKAAVQFKDFKLPLSELGTMLAFAQQKAKDTGQSVDYLVDSIVTGLGRQSTQILDNLGLSQAEVKERTKETGDMTKAVGDIIREQMAAAGDYVETAADRTTKSAVDMQNAMLEFGKTMQEATGMASWDELNNFLEADLIRTLNDIVKGAMEVKDVFIAINTVVSPLSSAMKDFGNMSSTVLSSVESAAWAALGPLGEILNVLRLIGGASSTGTVQDAVDKANRDAADKQKFTVYLPPEDNWRNKPQSAPPQTPKRRPIRRTHTGGGGRKVNPVPERVTGVSITDQSGMDEYMKMLRRQLSEQDFGSAIYQSISAQLTDMTTLKTLVDESLKVGLGTAMFDVADELGMDFWTRAMEGGVDDIDWQGILDKINEKRKEMGLDQLTLDFVKGNISTINQETGISISNQSGMTEYINMLQQQLSEADFGGAIYKSLSAQLTDMTTLQSLVAESLKVGLGTAMFDVADELGMDFWTRAMEGGVENIDWQAILDKINEKRKEMGLDQLVLDFDKGTFSNKDTSKKGGLGQVDKFVSGLSSVSSGLQQMGIQLPDGVTKLLGAAQGLMTVIQGVNSIISIFSSTTATAQITAENANTGMLAGLTAAVEGLQMAMAAKTFLPGFFANGGIVGYAAGGYFVPGNSYSGDNIPIMANAGEVVLNRAQTGVLASALSEQSAPATSTPYVSGEKIYLGMENYLKRIGRGEIVTSRH